MRVTLLIALVIAVFVASVSAQQIWKFCPGDRSKDLLTVSNVVIDPATPKSGAPLSITLQGELKEAIDGDAFMDVDVEYSGVSLFQGQVKVCAPDFLSCPIPAGKLDQVFKQDVPAFAPPGGPYTGTARLADANNNNFTCITFDFMMDSMASVQEEAALDDILIANVNSKDASSSWKAGRNKVFEGKTLSHVQQNFLTGSKLTPVTIQERKTLVALPEHFDWRTDAKLSKCIHPIRNQVKGAGSNVLSDRLCIQSNGETDSVFYKTKGVRALSGGVSEMQDELLNRGPIELGFNVYKDFLSYTGGVYKHTSGALLGSHNVKLIGWGVTSQNVPYWIIANSWGEDWGMNGTFWILRGQNECGIEANAIAVDVEFH